MPRGPHCRPTAERVRLGRGTNKSRTALPPGDSGCATGSRARPASRPGLSPERTQLVATATALWVLHPGAAE